MKNSVSGANLTGIERITFKTFVRGFLVAALFILISAGIVVNEKPFNFRAREGDVALKSVYAPFDFTYNDAIQIKKGELIIARGQRVLKGHITQFLVIEENASKRADI